MTQFETKDSGERAEFASGMRRDTEVGKPRFDLMRPLDVPFEDQFFTRVAALLARGAEKYAERNWEQANSQAELDRMKSSAARHFEQWLTGETDEDHAAATVFNLLAHETTAYKMARTAADEVEVEVDWLDPLLPTLVNKAEAAEAMGRALDQAKLYGLDETVCDEGDCCASYYEDEDEEPEGWQDLVGGTASERLTYWARRLGQARMLPEDPFHAADVEYATEEFDKVAAEVREHGPDHLLEPQRLLGEGWIDVGYISEDGPSFAPFDESDLKPLQDAINRAIADLASIYRLPDYYAPKRVEIPKSNGFATRLDRELWELPFEEPPSAFLDMARVQGDRRVIQDFNLYEVGFVVNGEGVAEDIREAVHRALNRRD